MPFLEIGTAGTATYAMRVFNITLMLEAGTVGTVLDSRAVSELFQVTGMI